MNKRLISVFFVAILLLTAFYLLTNRACKGISCINFKDKEAFSLKDTYQNDQTGFKGAYTTPETTLRISIKSVKTSREADAQIESEIQKVKSVFANAISPYPGEVSNEIECGKDFTPTFDQKKINGIDVNFLTSYLSERLTFGACTKEQAKYKEIEAFFYCPEQKNLVTFELIAKTEDFDKNQGYYEEILNSLKCAGKKSIY